jgi:hypothetical protein
LESSKKEKSRQIGIYQYFEILQLEWICCELRTKIYKKEGDKNYWKRVLEGKRKTIENIAERNKLPTIFDDEDLFLVLKSRIYKDTSYPNFMYKDETQRLSMQDWDLFYYYYKGTTVRYEYYGQSLIGVITKPLNLTLEPKTIELKCDTSGEFLKLPIEVVTRII